MGGVINNPPFQETFNYPTAAILGTIVAIYEIGCFFGALLCAAFGEYLGRKKSILIGIVIMLAGTAFQAAISSVGPMIAARIVSGLGMVSVLPHLVSDTLTRLGLHQLYYACLAK